MKTFKVNRNSWHYRFQDTMEVDPHWRTNFCSYWRGLVIAFVLAGFTTALIVACIGLAAVAASLVGSLIIAIWNHQFAFSFWGSILGGFIGLAVIAACVGFWWLIKIRLNKRTESGNVSERQPGVIATKYRSWKDKVCYKVEFYD
jgi:hypothetical protein